MTKRKRIKTQSVTMTMVDVAPARIDVLVCGDVDTPTAFTDNVQTTCDECGRAVQHRPHITADRHVCFGCFQRHAAAGDVSDVLVTRRTVLEAFGVKHQN